MASRAPADNIGAEQHDLHKLSRLGHPPPSQAFYEQTILAQPDTITMVIACIGLNINRETYDALWDYCKSELTEYGISSKYMELFLFRLHRPRRDPHFSFLEDDTIPSAWLRWALEGILSNVAAWMLESEHALDKPKRKRTLDHSEDEGGDSISNPKKQKTAQNCFEVLISNGDI